MATCDRLCERCDYRYTCKQSLTEEACNARAGRDINKYAHMVDGIKGQTQAKQGGFYGGKRRGKFWTGSGAYEDPVNDVGDNNV